MPVSKGSRQSAAKPWERNVGHDNSVPTTTTTTTTTTSTPVATGNQPEIVEAEDSQPETEQHKESIESSEEH